MANRGHGEGSIYQRKDGRWAASITVEGDKRKTFYGKTRKDVQEKLRVALNEQKQGILATGPRQTVGQFLTYWLENVQKPAVRIRTYMRYESQLRRHTLSVIGNIQLSKLSSQRIQTFYTHLLEKGLSSRTVRLIHTMLHKAFDYAVSLGYLPRNVCNVVSLPRVEKIETHALTLDQVRQLLEAAKGHRVEALFVLALVTGMRRGEILGLKWSDINFTEGVIHVQRSLVDVKGGVVESKPKTARGYRAIVLPSFVIDVLKKHQEQQAVQCKKSTQWQDHDYVFCTSHGTPFAAANLRTMFKALLKKAELPDIRFHDLRHSVATLLLSIGTHPKIVQELLGHGQISITMDTYSHVMPTLQRDTMAQLDDLLKPPGSADGNGDHRPPEKG